MIRCNQMIFDTETNDKALELAQHFLESLLEHNIKSIDNYNDIHIYQEETLIIIEWTQVFYNDDFSQDHFELIDSEHTVAKELIMPDNSTLYIFDYENENEVIENWHQENPGWIKENNRWVNKSNIGEKLDE